MISEECSDCRGGLEPHRIGNYRYCLACHAKWMRENRPKHSELSAEQRMKANTRAYANVYEGRGLLEKKPCACGFEEVEKHYEDYSKPLEVVYMCRRCHLAHHAQKNPRKVLQITNLREENENLIADELDKAMALSLDGW